MTDLLAIGASGVRAYQGALGTVSENIANASVEGYSRRTANLNEVISPGATISTARNTDGYGVILSGITRRADEFRTNAVRTAGADLARTETSAAWLDRIENALGAVDVDKRVTAFFTSARTMAADPSALAPRAAMIEAATSAANAFRTTGNALDRVRDEVDAMGDDTAAEMTSLGSALAKVNERIGRVAEGSSGAASLADERDRILERMSAIVDLDVAIDATGRAAVRLGGSGGPLLVAGSESGAVTYGRAGGVATFGVRRAGASGTVQPSGGAMAGIAEGASRVADTRAELNRVAGDFAKAVNDFQTAGQTLDNAPGTAIFAEGATPADLSVVMTDPRGIAAATTGTGPRDGGNLAALEDARANGRFEGRLSDLTSSNAAALAQRRTVAQAQSAIRDSAVSARDAVSGVDLDREAVDLLRFQQAYQASSRIIQVARETFQTILDSGR